MAKIKDNNVQVEIELRNSTLGSFSFPVNPESLRFNKDSNAETIEVIGLGEVSVAKTPKLATLTISSFFWNSPHNENSPIDVDKCVKWLKDWQELREPAQLFVYGFKYYGMWVTCESFWYEKRAGEEFTTYFELSLKEYRQHVAQEYKQSKAETFMLGVIKLNEMRGDNKPAISVPYKTSDNDNVTTVARKMDTEPAVLYEVNNGVLTNTLGTVEEGMELKKPTQEELINYAFKSTPSEEEIRLMIGSKVNFNVNSPLMVTNVQYPTVPNFPNNPIL